MAKKSKKSEKKKSSEKKQRKASAREPKRVKTGKGASALDVAMQVTDLLRAGKSAEVEEAWLAKDIESVEGVGVALAWKGKSAVLAKYRGWEADHEIHDMKLEGPWVGATGFALKYRIDLTQKSTGQRTQMEEIAVYTVQDGKIVREEFHYATGDPS